MQPASDCFGEITSWPFDSLVVIRVSVYQVVAMVDALCVDLFLDDQVFLRK
jgi:hypothetical protein